MILTLAIFLTKVSTYAQTIEIVSKNKSKFKATNRFEFLNSGIKTSSSTFIATINSKGKDKNSSIPNLFFKIKEKACDLGANSFKVNKYTKRNSAQETILTLDIYRTHDSILEINSTGRSKNIFYIFLDDNDPGDSYTFTINDIDREIESGTYYRYEVKKGQKVEIGSGGLLGASGNYKWKENNPSVFITLTDFGLPPDHNEPEYLARYFNTKRLNTIDPNLGLLLVELTDD